MKKKFAAIIKLLGSCVIFFSAIIPSHALNIRIIESASAGHTMAVRWFNVAVGMGHTAIIVPQTTLDNNAFFATTDILIVSSGVIALSPLRISTIQQFIQTGKSAYLQTEYNCAVYTSNSGYASIVNALGGNFTWGGVISGTLAPMTVLGSLSNTLNVIPPLTYFWWGCRGTGCANIEYFLQYNGNYFGFIFCPPNTSYGRLITTSDQDWVQSSTSLPLMQNIITNMAATSYSCVSSSAVNVFLGNDTTLCTGQQLTLNAQNPAATFQWSTGATSQTITVTTTGTYWVRVSIGGCLVSDTINVTYANLGNVNLGNDTSLCAGLQLTLDAQNSGSLYTWSTGATTQTIVVTASGNYWVHVINNGCVADDTINVTFTPLPVVSAQNQQDVLCNGASTGSATVTITSGTNPYTYSWSPAGGSNATANTLSAGTYTVIVTDATGCTTSQTFVITEPPAIILSATATATTCGNSNGTASSTVSGGTGTFSYQWSPAGGSSANATALAGGTYTVTVTDGNGCTTSTTVNVGASVPASVSLFSQIDVLCFGDSTGSATVNASGTPPYIYSWIPTGGTGTTENNLPAGTYTVIISDVDGCTSSTTAVISEPASALATSVSGINADCGQSNGEASVVASGGTTAYSYLWSNGATTATDTGLVSGLYTVIVTDANNCTISNSVFVGNNPNTTITISNDTIIMLGSSALLYASGGVIYSWTPSEDLSCNSCPDPVASPAQSTIYCVNVVDSLGCTFNGCIKVLVEIPCGEIFIPNAFSPNGDNSNDMQCIFGGCISSMVFSIYDRWGEKVFESSDPKRCWNGIYNGKLLNSAVFVYYFNAVLTTGEQVNKKGNISLIR